MSIIWQFFNDFLPNILIQIYFKAMAWTARRLFAFDDILDLI